MQRGVGLFLLIFLLSSISSNVSAGEAFYAIPLAEQFKQLGYVELCESKYGATTFDTFYTSFDTFIEFLQKNPTWTQKLYRAKERFIRSKDRDCYSTDFFGLYDELDRPERRQISFYYAIHFHEFICSHFPEFNELPEVISFLEACRELQKPCGTLFNEAVVALGVGTIFTSSCCHPPILLKVVKYLPAYGATRPHYDGSVLSLFLDSTDNRSLLLAPYRSSYTVDDFSCPLRKFSREEQQHSVMLIPGVLLSEWSIYPTPHIVVHSGKVRYATIAFALRSHYTPPKKNYSPLPNFNY